MSATAGGTDASNVDALFNTLDGDGDGKVTQSEMAEGLKQLA